jgi:hypothetical protein
MRVTARVTVTVTATVAVTVTVRARHELARASFDACVRSLLSLFVLLCLLRQFAPPSAGPRDRRVGAGRGLATQRPPHTVVPMPALSPTMEAGTIASWKVQEGASFAAGDIICEIETDKATVDNEAQDEGVCAGEPEPEPLTLNP